MSLKLSKTNTPTYDYYSEGDGTDPISTTVTLTNVGGTLDTNTVTAYLIATAFRYTGISITLINEVSGIDYKLSLNNSTWLDTITPTDMNALAADVVTPIYIKAVVNNNNTVPTQISTQPDVRITALEQAE